MTSSYVILTGSKNNAGDFLIKNRAKKLFSTIRPERSIIDLNAWEAFDDKCLEVINNSKALILMGGPALKENMYPGVYRLTSELDQIKVPITMMGVGWKSFNGEWGNTYNFKFNSSTKKLLDRIDNDGLTSSVRDFHSLNTLAFNGYHNVIMTGCPAYYELDYIDKPFELPGQINRVAFSLGVSFVESPLMEKLMKNQILAAKKYYSGARFEVVFHHSLDPNVFLNTHGARKKHNVRHIEFSRWLTNQNISYVDISGSAENLIEYYSNIDMHLGYRVHAHIFMNSLAKMSLLISEDGRAKGSKSAINGLVINGYDGYRDGFLSKVMNRLFHGYNRYLPNQYSIDEFIHMVNYEVKTQGHRSKLARLSIKNNFYQMEDFLRKLP